MIGSDAMQQELNTVKQMLKQAISCLPAAKQAFGKIEKEIIKIVAKVAIQEFNQAPSSNENEGVKVIQLGSNPPSNSGEQNTQPQKLLVTSLVEAFAANGYHVGLVHILA